MIDVVVGPAGRIPAIVEEEFNFTFIGLQVSDVDNPELSGRSGNGKGKLFMDLFKLGALRRSSVTVKCKIPQRRHIR